MFLVGFPRSGTTLLDQILDSHPALTTMEERDALDQVRRAVDGCRRLSRGMAGLDDAGVADLRRLYWGEVAQHPGRSRRAYAGRQDAAEYHRCRPRPPPVPAGAHPAGAAPSCDVVLSGFMQAMQPNAAMMLFDSLLSTAQFYAEVMDLWRHYRAVLPLTWLDVRYEDLVADFPGQTQRILSFLGLPWDDAVLGYAEHAKTRSIATPSYHQVVQPIYRRSVDRWRNYAFAFDDVLPVLQPFITAFGYATASAEVGGEAKGEAG
ncbi:MAG: sulfotransferase [Rhodospirillales bacterium]